MRNVVLLALVMSSLGAVPSIAMADEPDAGALAREKLEGAKLDSTIADIAKARKDLRTLRASFTQSRRITLLATTVSSRGEMTYAAPERLRWDLAAPDDIVYFVGPEGLSYKAKGSAGVTAPPTSKLRAKGLGDLRVLLGGDLSALRERYVLGGSRGPNDVEITGAVKDPEATIRGFTLVLDKGLVVPVRARLQEGKTDNVEIVFSNVAVNVPVDPARLKP